MRLGVAQCTTTPHWIISTHLYISMAASSSSPNSSSFSSSSSSVMSSYVLTVQRKQQSRQVITRSANNLTFSDHLNGVKLENTEHFQKYQTLYLISLPEFSWIHLPTKPNLYFGWHIKEYWYLSQTVYLTNRLLLKGQLFLFIIFRFLFGRKNAFLPQDIIPLCVCVRVLGRKQSKNTSYVILSSFSSGMWCFLTVFEMPISKLKSVSLKRIIKLQSLIYAQTKHISFNKLGMSNSLRHCGLGCVLFSYTIFNVIV